MKFSFCFRTVAVVGFLLISQIASAQQEAAGSRSPAFRIGDHALALGFGLGIRYGYPVNSAIAPAVMAVYDAGVGEGFGSGTLGLGGIVAWKTARYAPIPFQAGPDYRAHWQNVLVAARLSQHFAMEPGFENLDLYGGLMGGFRVYSNRRTVLVVAGGTSVLTEESTFGVQPVVGFFGGGRYNFSPQAGAWLEIGYDVSLIKAGMHLNF